MEDINIYSKNTARFLHLMNRLRQLRTTSSLPPGAKVSPALMPIIDYLERHPASGVKDVATALGLARPTVSVSLRRLERQGLITRQPHPEDSRAIQLFLTPNGRRLHQEVHLFRSRLAAKMLSGLEAQEQKEFLRLLTKALKAAENYKAVDESHSGRIA